MAEILPWLIAVLPLFALSLTIFNSFVWPRGRAGRSARGYAVLIPARNEEQTIGMTVRSALQQPIDEVIVYNDGSTDATGDVLAAIAADDARLRVVQGLPLPSGWVGKPHACHRLSEETDAEVLFFLDADVELHPGAVERIDSLLDHYGAQAVTAVPQQRVESFFERLVLPMLHVTYLSWLPLPLVWRTNDPRFLAANGQVLAIRRTAYDSVGGFEAVRDAVVDDMAICSELKRKGHRVVFADGHDLATCRMYASAADVWEGFSKNIFEGIGSVAGLVLVLVLYLLAFVLPWALLPYALVTGAMTLAVASAAAIGANLLQRAIVSARHGYSWPMILLHPVSTLTLCAIAVNSWIWHLRGDIQWAGRSYVRKEARRG